VGQVGRPSADRSRPTRLTRPTSLTCLQRDYFRNARSASPPPRQSPLISSTSASSPAVRGSVRRFVPLVPVAVVVCVLFVSAFAVVVCGFTSRPVAVFAGAADGSVVVAGAAVVVAGLVCCARVSSVISPLSLTRPIFALFIAARSVSDPVVLALVSLESTGSCVALAIAVAW